MSQVEGRATRHLDRLCTQIGSRPLGSARNREAAEYIQQVMFKAGLESEAQYFACPQWEDRGTRLELGGTRYVAAANTFSPPCRVVARPAFAGALAELRVVDLSGHIAILYGDLTAGNGFSSKSAFHIPERDTEILRLLEEKKPAAVITVHPHTGSLQRLISDWQFSIPSATVPAEVGLVLLRKPDQPLQLHIDSQRKEAQPCNVVGRVGKLERRITLCAHFDTVSDTPGAIDNGSGMAALLTLAETLARKPLHVALEFIALNGQENGGVGVAEYLHSQASNLDGIVAAINLDGVGQMLGPNTIATFSDCASLSDEIAAVIGNHPGVVPVDPWHESDHTAFVRHGIPSIAVSSSGVANVMHLPSDTLDWLNVAKVEQVVHLVQDIIARLQDKPTGWCRQGTC
ncbi:MAG: M28 family peptidase [Chloroflexi bacterium]|nr:M28 family peptidase [Chloroflexota bacterium]